MLTGKRSPGFSLVEMLVVLTIIGLLAAIAAPLVSNAVVRARENTLRQNLTVMRKLIDDYYADRGQFPASLEVLVKEEYLRAIPADPVNDGKVEWEEQKSEKEQGIEDVHSRSRERGSNGVPYAKW
jgi:general secretion pathway protein G